MSNQIKNNNNNAAEIRAARTIANVERMLSRFGMSPDKIKNFLSSDSANTCCGDDYCWNCDFEDPGLSAREYISGRLKAGTQDKNLKGELSDEDFIRELKRLGSFKTSSPKTNLEEGKSVVDTLCQPDCNTTNVTFTPSGRTEETEVYVDGVKVDGVIRAILDYDAEFGEPVLKLEIISPRIVQPYNCACSTSKKAY